MTVRGTGNFVFYVDKVLGAGSTGTVFFGRHKRKGDPCACKLFTRQESRSKVQIKENELNFMRQLDHPNIVKCLAIEADTRTKETVLVMELCAEGSMQKILTDPENVHGLPEDIFRDFFAQFVEGLHYLALHGIAHRDIKPGNILCCKDEEGRVMYKLTDFGATRELVTGSSSNALYGTEEYLYPEIYRRVLIDKVSVDSGLEPNAEIWSIGVTIYHVATGQLPFSAYGGRNNRAKMYEIISKKKYGIISGVQSTENGKVVYTKDLPATCSLSVALQEELVKIIANTAENDKARQWKYDQFFPYCQALSKTSRVVVFDFLKSIYHRIYLPANESFKKLQLELQRFTNVAVNNQILLYESRFLNDSMNSDVRIDAFPSTSVENPFVLLSSSATDWNRMSFNLPKIPTKPAVGDEPNTSTDVVLSREASALCWRAVVVTETMINCQMQYIECRRNVMNNLITRIRNAKKIFDALSATVDTMCANLELFKVQQMNIAQLLEEKSDKNDVSENEQNPMAEIEKHAEQCRTWNLLIEEIGQGLTGLVQLTVSEEIQQAPQPVPMCKDACCSNKLREKFKQACEIYAIFIEDKTRQMSYNENQIHKYHRVKLMESLNSVIDIVEEHCIKSTEKEHRLFKYWFSETYLNQNSQLKTVEQKISNLRSQINKLLHQIEILLDQINQQKAQLLIGELTSSSAGGKVSSAASSTMSSFMKTLFTRKNKTAKFLSASKGSDVSGPSSPQSLPISTESKSPVTAVEKPVSECATYSATDQELLMETVSLMQANERESLLQEFENFRWIIEPR